MENYTNMTINSVTVNENSIASLIELTGIPYLTSYSFSGIYADDINLGNIDKPFIIV